MFRWSGVHQERGVPLHTLPAAASNFEASRVHIEAVTLHQAEMASALSESRASALDTPRVRSKRKTEVLDEDEWTRQIESIVERDFFPDLPKLRNKLEWLQVCSLGPGSSAFPSLSLVHMPCLLISSEHTARNVLCFANSLRVSQRVPFIAAGYSDRRPSRYPPSSAEHSSTKGRLADPDGCNPTQSRHASAWQSTTHTGRHCHARSHPCTYP